MFKLIYVLIFLSIAFCMMNCLDFDLCLWLYLMSNGGELMVLNCTKNMLDID